MGHNDELDELTALYSTLAESQPVVAAAVKSMAAMAETMREASAVVASEARRVVQNADEALLRTQRAREWLAEVSADGGTFPALEGKTPEESLKIFLELY